MNDIYVDAYLLISQDLRAESRKITSLRCGVFLRCHLFCNSKKFVKFRIWIFEIGEQYNQIWFFNSSSVWPRRFLHNPIFFLSIYASYFLKKRYGLLCKIISIAYIISKVEKILKGSLDLIPSPSPSVKIQIMGGKVCFRCKGKRQNIAGHCQQTFENKTFVDNWHLPVIFCLITSSKLCRQ